VADEMFIGRNAEMNDICSENGPCLVYGGRQLGKTALLQRARSVQHQPEEKMYAVYVEIRNKQEADLLKVLQKELRRVGLDIGNCETF
jgi:predicted AAA+ superfamily ATPase